jgi:hypothetical protein
VAAPTDAELVVTLQEAYRDLLDTTRQYKRERAAAREHLDRLAAAVRGELLGENDSTWATLACQYAIAANFLDQPQQDDTESEP